jgi:predicted methyltransferase
MTLRTLFVALMLSGCATTSPKAGHATVDYDALVNAPDRTDDDRAIDPGRHPAQFLAVLGVKPGMRVGELFAGGGYTTELLARAVEPGGTVYGQNSKDVLELFAQKPWTTRLLRPVNKKVVRLDRPTEDPFPLELSGTLDLVVTNANYHDAIWQMVDTAKMNKAVFNALKPGGRYVVSDSSAKVGSGKEAAKTLHRIDEELVKREVQAAGFTLERSDDLLRNPNDTRDWNASPRAAAEKRGTSDRFILVFVKP